MLGEDDSSDDDIFGVDLAGASIISSDEEDEEEAGVQSGVSLNQLIAPCFQSLVTERPVEERPVEDSRVVSMNRLASWVVASGGFIHESLHLTRMDGTCNLGGFAKNPLETGEIVIRVPSKCCLACDDTGVGNLDVNRPSSIQQVDLKSIALACALAGEIRLGEGSSISPYITSLPSRLEDFPLNWTKSEIIKLATSEACETALRSQAVMLRREYDHVQACTMALTGGDVSPYSFDEYRVARLLVCSRCFKIGDAVMLLPLIDMLNHHRHPHLRLHNSVDPPPSNGSPNGLIIAEPPPPTEPSADLSLSGLSGPPFSPEIPPELPECSPGNSSFHGFALSTIQPVPSRGEVFNNYGTRDDLSWLLNYGFVPDDGSSDPEHVTTSAVSTASSEIIPPHLIASCDKLQSSPVVLRLEDKLYESGATAGAAARLLSSFASDRGHAADDGADGCAAGLLREPRDELAGLLDGKLVEYDSAIAALRDYGDHTRGGVVILSKERNLIRETKTALLALSEVDMLKE